ncbi:hypothetical protein CC78DRAFT_492281 [Lojkania enalia]|uniref:AMMECR1 domain-containing protein n=1 Tax=Lojkania enalia TaxID=147567 RepID=A0A9P4KCI4_9PLEO|nr:hypothetical protein CC78DRAFT_492281 [Didymosphaeria enalia]
MATQAHCAYCFETISASLDKRSPAPLPLPKVEALWKRYNTDPADEPTDPDHDPSDSEMEDAPPADATLDPRPAAISRLLVPSPSTTSSFFSLPKRLHREKESESVDLDRSPLFVTWNIVTRSGDKRLRGCIGTFEAQDLDDGLRSYAITSAFEDTRFNPIELRELPSLECGVTLLTNFEPIASPLDWQIGIHGLRISFTYHGRRYGSTYLPDVAKEQGWTKEETMISLMRKAGWSGKKEDWRNVDLTVVRYQGRQVRLAYREWREWRDWIESEEKETTVMRDSYRLLAYGV